MRVLFTLLNKCTDTRYSFFYANRFEQEITYTIFTLSFQIKMNLETKINIIEMH